MLLLGRFLSVPLAEKCATRLDRLPRQRTRHLRHRASRRLSGRTAAPLGSPHHEHAGIPAGLNADSTGNKDHCNGLHPIVAMSPVAKCCASACTPAGSRHLACPCPLGGIARAAEAAASGRILVVVELSGANDGLNTVVPYRDDAYYRARPRLGIRAGQAAQDRRHFRLPVDNGRLRAAL